jgi:hypothetical protein
MNNDEVNEQESNDLEQMVASLIEKYISLTRISES